MKALKVRHVHNRLFNLLLFLALCFSDIAQIHAGETLNPNSYVVSRGNHSGETRAAIPSGSLKHSGDGSTVLSAGSPHLLDDDLQKKPRPYFAADALFISDTRSFEALLLELLDYIGRLLDKPNEELTESQLNVSINELETLYEKKQQINKEREKDAIQYILGSNADENSGRFIHHPGYQEHHPAHPERQYTVPGIVETPVKKGGGNTHKTKTHTSKNSSTPGSLSQNMHSGKAGSSRDTHDDNPPPPKRPKSDISRITTETTELIVSKNITTQEGTYEITAELNRYEQDLYCAVCINLCGEEAVQCLKCCQHFCADHLPSLENCPSCRHELDKPPQCNLKLRINNINWRCPKGCEELYDLSDMRSHIPTCTSDTIYQCEHDHCLYSGTFEDVSTHEQDCTHRAVRVGPVTMEQCQLRGMEECIANFRRVYRAPQALSSQPLQIQTLNETPRAYLSGFTASNQAELNTPYSQYCQILAATSFAGLMMAAFNNLSSILAGCPDTMVICLYCRQKRPKYSRAIHECFAQPEQCKQCLTLQTHGTIDAESHNCSGIPSEMINIGSRTLHGKFSDGYYTYTDGNDDKEIFFLIEDRQLSMGLFTFCDLEFELRTKNVDNCTVIDAYSSSDIVKYCSADLISTDGKVIKKLVSADRFSPHIGLYSSERSGFYLDIPESHCEGYVFLRFVETTTQP